MTNAPRTALLLLASVLALALPGLGRAATRHLAMSFADTVTPTNCPASAGAATCYSLSGHASPHGFGPTAIGPLLDVEVDPSDSRCHTTTRADDTLRFDGGTLDVAVTGPTLCAGILATYQRTFTVTGGGGVFSGATGGGNTTIAALAQGATETWSGDVSAPGLPAQDLRPTGRIASAKITNLQHGEQLTAAFSAASNGWPTLLSYRATATLARHTTSTVGKLRANAVRVVRLRLPKAAGTITLTIRITDANGNTITISRTIRKR